MQMHLYKVSGYEECILSLRMSKGNYYSLDNAKGIQELVWLVTDLQGFICDKNEYTYKANSLFSTGMEKKIATGDYDEDVNEFKRLLTLTFDNAMGKQKHHTLMKYIDISFISEGLHRGAQDDLDAHAIAFNNRITRFSTRLAEISEYEMSEWYKDKIIPFNKAIEIINKNAKEHHIYNDLTLPPYLQDENGNNFRQTPFGYVIEKHAQVPAKNGLDKDVQRGLIPLGIESNALWKIDIFNLRYVYKMRSKLTKANPELKDAMEMLADQVEANIPVFGKYFRKEMTDTGEWEHQNKVKTVTSEQLKEYKQLLYLNKNF